MPEGAIQVGVLADDLTGALASAGLLAEAGLRPTVRWRPGVPPHDATAVVVDMRTRDYGTDPEGRAERWAAELAEMRCSRVELRIDSTLRGAPAAELRGALAGLGRADPRVLTVPAFPSAGRTVVAGKLHAPALGAAEPPFEIAPVLFGEHVPVIDVPVVERGPDAVVRAVRDGRGSRFVADATTESHLRTLAAAADTLAEDTDRGLLTVSPGAWLRYYRPASSRRRVLVVLSSDTATNHEQLAQLTRDHAATVLHAGELLDGRADPLWQDMGEVVVVETISRPAAGAVGAWRQSTVAAEAAAKLITETARHGTDWAGVVVGGGQTGSALMDALGAEYLTACGEFAPLCPHGKVEGGEWSGLPVITKGGLVGGRSTLSGLVEMLRKEGL
jgi:uncharacterized protein YgbK (DUF1537 family)